MDDDKMAEKLIEGLEWLADKGRTGRELVEAKMTDRSCLGEAIAQLEDIPEA